MIHSLLNTLEKRLDRALKTGTSACASNYISLETTLDDNFPVSPVDHLTHFFLNKSDDQNCLLGLGELVTIKASGKPRFESLKKQFNLLLYKWHNHNIVTPIAFIAFAFDENDQMLDDWQGLPNALLKIPRIVIKQTPTGKILQVNMLIHPATQSESTRNEFKTIYTLLSDYLSQHLSKQPEIPLKTELNITTDSSYNKNKLHWHKLSRLALDEIHKGSFDKLVTSRQQWVKLKQAVSLSALTAKLIRYYPACTVLSFLDKGKKLVCASPERLIHVQDCIIKSEAIGGTILKAPTQNHHPPRLLPTDQNNPEYYKLLKEHRFIAQDIYQRLDPLCLSLKMPCSPYLMKLHNMYHLETPIEGVLEGKFDIFDVIKALHPTPAIAGFPALKAQQWLVNHEGYQRGWYSGAFGWLDGRMNGELSVMLRCALLNSEQAHLYAGAGLISESDPEIEWRETELKMQTILEML